MPVSIPFKRGDTFLVEATATAASVPQDLTGWSIRSQVRQGSTLVADLSVEYTNRPSGVFRLSAPPALTQSWPVKVLSCDIEYTTASGQVVSTETFEIDCKGDVTQ